MATVPCHRRCPPALAGNFLLPQITASCARPKCPPRFVRRRVGRLVASAILADGRGRDGGCQQRAVRVSAPPLPSPSARSNLVTAQPRTRSAGGRDSPAGCSARRAPIGITEAADHRPLERRHRAVLGALGRSKPAAKGRRMIGTWRHLGRMPGIPFLTPCPVSGGPFRMGRDERDRVPLRHFRSADSGTVAARTPARRPFGLTPRPNLSAARCLCSAIHCGHRSVLMSRHGVCCTRSKLPRYSKRSKQSPAGQTARCAKQPCTCLALAVRVAGSALLGHVPRLQVVALLSPGRATTRGLQARIARELG